MTDTLRTTLPDAPIHVDDETFEQQVLSSPVPVLVDFWAPWCGPCRMVAPVLEDLASELAGRVVIAKINTDQHPRAAMQFHVQGIPTLILFQGGREVDRVVGALPKSPLKARLEAHLAPAA